ncbi:hypothetical protein [Catenovulum sediminis]|uniref:Uncharacterized protein n=1 Tax=Catenovulum sediminis TaxID=1740262 RepID=A0ABV1RMR6_9ALTE
MTRLGFLFILILSANLQASTITPVVEADSLTLEHSLCEYGRGLTVIETLKENLDKQIVNYLTTDAKAQLSQRIESGSRSIIAAINLEKSAAAIVSGQIKQEYQDPYLQGSETCLDASVKLTANLPQGNTNHIWQSRPSLNFVYAKGSMEGTNEAAMQQAQQVAIADALQQSLNLLTSSAPQTLAFLNAQQMQKFKQAAHQKLTADYKSLLNSWRVLNQYTKANVSYSHLLISIDTKTFESKLFDLIKLITDTQISIKSDNLQLSQQLKQLFTKRKLKVSPNNNAQLQLNASAKMIKVNNGYQASIEITAKDTQGRTVMSWQNDPGLLTVSNNRQQTLNQLLLAHLSVPDNSEYITTHIESAVFDIALGQFN